VVIFFPAYKIYRLAVTNVDGTKGMRPDVQIEVISKVSIFLLLIFDSKSGCVSINNSLIGQLKKIYTKLLGT